MIEGHNFYYKTIRKVVATFGTLFNSIAVSKRDASDNVLSTTIVPIAFGPKRNYIAKSLIVSSLKILEIKL